MTLHTVSRPAEASPYQTINNPGKVGLIMVHVVALQGSGIPQPQRTSCLLVQWEEATSTVFSMLPLSPGRVLCWCASLADQLAPLSWQDLVTRLGARNQNVFLYRCIFDLDEVERWNRKHMNQHCVHLVLHWMYLVHMCESPPPHPVNTHMYTSTPVCFTGSRTLASSVWPGSCNSPWQPATFWPNIVTL